MAPGTDECQVRDVTLRDGQLGPVLVKFEHAKLKKHDASDLKCGVYTSTTRQGSVCTVAAVAEDGDVVYQGDVQKEGGDICRTFLAVRNKRKNKVRIYEASSVMLSPSMASSFVDQFDAQDRSEALYKLHHAFGSKKAKRLVDQRARMAVNADAVKEKLSSTVNDITVSEDTLKPVPDDTFMSLLPPCNREAAVLPDVYPISGMLDKKEIKSLVQYLSNAEKDDQNLDPSRLSPFYQSLVKKASASPKVAALLLYAESLIRLSKMKKIILNQEICLYSQHVDKRIRTDFCGQGGFIQHSSNVLVDKIIAYLIVLGLHINEFSLDLDIVTRSIPFVPSTRVRTLAQLAGTRSTAAAGAPKALVLLKLPLPPLAACVPKRSRQR